MPRRDRWEKSVKLVELAFQSAEIPPAFSNVVLVLIPKDKPGEYRGIALLEVIYKLCSNIITMRLQDGIDFHDSIHGFRRHRGTATATIETKLRMQLAFRQQTPYYQIFIDLRKAYDTLDRERTIKILQGYGVGPRIIKLLRRVWDDDCCVPKAGGFFGDPFAQNRGVRQGDGLSPIIFNIVEDAVIRAWLAETDPVSRAALDVIFYADDGRLGSTLAPQLQMALDQITLMFERVGLKMNADKTKFMVTAGARPYGQLSDDAYHRMMLGEGPTYVERQKQMVTCPHCGEEMQRRHMQSHCRREHGRVAPSPPCALHGTFRYRIGCG